MNRFWIGFGVGLVVAVACIMSLWVVASLLGNFGIGGLSYVGNGHASSPQQTNSAGNLSVTFGGEPGSQVVFSRGQDTFTFTPMEHESCQDAIVSPDGKTALLQMQTVQGFGYNYACIMRFDFGAEPLARVQPKRSLTLQELNTFLGGNRSWVTEIYKFSRSGDRVLLGVSTLPSSRTKHAAYWYNLTSNPLEEP